MLENNNLAAKPVLKWAGGKGQLISILQQYLPLEIQAGQLTTYIEPFVGGGAFFFYLAAQFPLKNYILMDINAELIIVYRALQKDAAGLIAALAELKEAYFSCPDQTAFFYARRDEYNQLDKNINANFYECGFVHRAALTVFLNKTCFNGLYRVNRRNQFNVPAGRYKNPAIFDRENLLCASAILQKAEILHADFAKAAEFGNEHSFIYYDPPYRPIKRTSSFNSYNFEEFDDAEQRRLKQIFDRLNQTGARQMLSNSDPTNYGEDDFFDELYKGYHINRILARRMINANGRGRQAIREILITNYER